MLSKYVNTQGRISPSTTPDLAPFREHSNGMYGQTSAIHVIGRTYNNPVYGGSAGNGNLYEEPDRDSDSDSDGSV